MRSLTRDDQDDRGAVLVWVALMIVVLLGVGALVLDMGALYAERRELQNGADAAAVAVATDCIEGNCMDEVVTARTYAGLNAEDGKSRVDDGDVCGKGFDLNACPPDTPVPPKANAASGWVRVTASTLTENDESQIEFTFARVFGDNGGTVEASAVAAWGGIGGATTLPIAFGLCEYERTKNLPPPHFIYPKSDTTECPGSPPGGFLWIGDDNDGTCSVSTAIGFDVGSNTGLPEPKDCWSQDPHDKSAWIEPLIGEKILIPLFDASFAQGNNGGYEIIGYMGFILDGYDLVQSGRENLVNGPGGECIGPGLKPCLKGTFTELITGDAGGGPDFGARTISIVG